MNEQLRPYRGKLTPDAKDALVADILDSIKKEPWRHEATANMADTEKVVKDGIEFVQELEDIAHDPHPKLRTDTDIVYIDSGPGPYSYAMLEPGKADLEDTQYHQWPWTRKMDRARIRTGVTIVQQITAMRVKEQTGKNISTKDLTEDYFQRYGPYLMYASTSWQQAHIDYVRQLSRERGTFQIPEQKVITYTQFKSREGGIKPIINTEDQMEGLHFPIPSDDPYVVDGDIRRIVMVSQPAHLLRIMHVLGKYPDSIPQHSVLQVYPVQTPLNAGTEYTKAEVMGTLAAIYKKRRATVEPFSRFTTK